MYPLKLNPRFPSKILPILLTILFSSGIYPGALFPIRGVSGILSEMKSKGYMPGPKSQFHVKLKQGESVRYIITVPFYLSETAVGIMGESTVQKMKVLIYTLSGRDDIKGRLILGDEVSSNFYIKEIKEKSYYYMVEITLEEGRSQDYISIDLVYGFKASALAKEDPVTKEVYYEHSDERIIFSSPKKRDTPTPSDTGRNPCTTFDMGRNCIPPSGGAEFKR